MLVEKIYITIAKLIYKEAVNSVDSTCIYWHHQPEIPAVLKSIKEGSKKTYENRDN